MFIYLFDLSLFIKSLFNLSLFIESWFNLSLFIKSLFNLSLFINSSFNLSLFTKSLFNSSCLRSYQSANGPQCLSYLHNLIDCMRINCNFFNFFFL